MIKSIHSSYRLIFRIHTVGIYSFSGRLTGDLVSCLPEVYLDGDPAGAGGVREDVPDPGGVLAVAPKVGEGIKKEEEEEEGKLPNPNPDEDGEVGSKGVVETAKERKGFSKG